MDSTKMINRNIAGVGWGALLIWWGVVVLIGPITIGMGAIGTGLILLGLTAWRRLKGVPIRNANVPVGLIAIAWGAVDTAFRLQFWPSFAALLIIIGLVEVVKVVSRQPSVVNGQE